MDKIPYNIVAVARSAKGEETRKTVNIGHVEQNRMTDVILGFCILDYSSTLMREMKKHGYKIAKIEDHPNFVWRKLIFTDGSVITITTQAA